jgi:hypothetical protein
MGTYASKDTAINSNTVKRLVRGGADKLRIIRSPEEGWDVVDGHGTPLPTLSLVNDPRGTRFNHNVDVSEWGYMRSLSTTPAFDLTRTLEQNILPQSRLGSLERVKKMKPAHTAVIGQVSDVLRSVQVSETCICANWKQYENTGALELELVLIFINITTGGSSPPAVPPFLCTMVK